jgi:hypothetical protein
VNPLHILDATALIGLVEGHDLLMRMHRRAELGQLLLGVPETAIHDAEAMVRHGENAWTAMLDGDGIVCLGLTLTAALKIAKWPGDLSVKHCVYEARVTRGIVVTCKPILYADYRVPLLAV